MILKFTLPAANFASLAKFLASRENSADLLKGLHPRTAPRFRRSDSFTGFASLLKCTPQKGCDDGSQEVTLMVAEEYVVQNIEHDERVPQQYLDRLFKSVSLYPHAIVEEKICVLDIVPNVSPKDPFVYTYGCGNYLGEGILEKKADGKLYLNGKEILRREIYEWQDHAEVQMNACVFDALVANPRLIPDDWTDKTYFPGTRFYNKDNRSDARWIKGFERGHRGELFCLHKSSEERFPSLDCWEAYIPDHTPHTPES